MQVDILTSIILPLSLFLIMFGMGLSLKLSNFRSVLQYPKPFLIGFSTQMLILPLVAFIIANVMSMPAELAVGMMIIALAPGGATSNMFSYLYKGDVALSISLTAIVGIITPFTIPIVVGLSMEYFSNGSIEFSMPILKTIIQLLVITVVPVALGMIFLKIFPNLSKKIEPLLKWFSVVFMFVIIGLIIYRNWANVGGYFYQTGLATLLLNIIALALGFYLAKYFSLSKKQRITIGFEVGIQNGTLALVVAGTLIGNPTMMIPAVTYGLLMFLTGALFGWLCNRGYDSAID